MLLFWPLVIPFATAVATILAWRSRRLQQTLSLAGTLALVASGGIILARVIATGPFAEQAGGWPAPFGITLVADGLSATMVVLAGVVALATVVFGLGDVSEAEERLGHHPLTHAMLAGVSGAFLTGDIFNMYVWFEVMLIATFGLLVVGGGRAGLDGATKYVGLNLIGTVAFIAGVGLLYGTAGALNMADLHGRLAGRGGEAAVLASAAFLLFAFGAKAALFPVFFWLPASYHTPSFPTSALFAALLTKVGVYALLRVFTLVYDIDGGILRPLLVWVALLSMATGALGALVMPSIRRVLGFTIISSIGTMVLGIAVGTPLAIAAVVLYLVQDVLVKAGLFLGAGAVARLTGSETLAATGGIWRASPGTALLLLMPLLALAGMPPLSGFWPKLMLVNAFLGESDGWLAAAVLATGFLTLMAVARIWAAAVWAPHPAGEQAVAERLPAAMLVPLLALVAAIVGLGVVAAPFVDGAGAIAAGILDPTAYIVAVLEPAP